MSEENNVIIPKTQEGDELNLLPKNNEDSDDEIINLDKTTTTVGIFNKIKIQVIKYKNQIKKEQIKWLISLAKPEIVKLIIGTLAMAVTAGVNLVLPWFIGKLIDKVLHSGQSFLMELVLILFGLSCIQAVTTFIRTYCFNVAGESVVAQLRKTLFNAFVEQEIAFFDEIKTGELMNRLSSDTKVLENTVTVNLSMAGRYTIQSVGGVILLFTISWQLCIFMLVLIPVVLLIVVCFAIYVKKLAKQYQDHLAKASNVAEESLGLIRTVRSFAKEDERKKQYGEKITDSFRLAKKLAIARGLFGSGMMVVGNICMIFVLWYGGTLVINGSMTIGTLTSFLLYTIFVAGAFAVLSGLLFDLIKTLGATERVYNLVHRKSKIPINSKGKIIEKPQGKIEFKNVSFTYPSRPKNKVLDNLTLTLPSNKITALVGISGGGKSTLISLMQRFYDISEGQILFDGVPIKEIDYFWLRNQISTVQQEPSLFGCTIKENILFGSGVDISEKGCEHEDIVAVSKEANCHDFIMKFENGYDTLVGERGIRLSGGQKQRIAIARALLRNPKILLLDEFTSALDAESEKLVKDAIVKIMKNRTVLIIAHRLATVKSSDMVYVIKKGKVIEQGSHIELIQKNGIYNNLVNHQLLK